MYSRYPSYEPETPSPVPSRGPPREPDVYERAEPESRQRGGHRQGGFGGLLGNLGNLGNLGGFGGLLRNFKLDWDSGDILMILIILFLSTESDDTEIMILLALMLFMGLDN